MKPSPARYQQQISAEGPVGAAVWGVSPRQVLVATHKPQRDRSRGIISAPRAGFTTCLDTTGGGSRSRTFHSHRPASLPRSRRPASCLLRGVGQNSGVLRDNSARRRFSFSPSSGCSRSLGQSIPHKPICQSASRVVVHPSCLSNPCSLAGSTNASKRAQDHGKVSRDLGYLTQGQFSPIKRGKASND